MNFKHASMRFVSTLLAIATDWLIIGCSVAASERWFSVPGCTLAIIIIASRQHALGVLAHEAIHWPPGKYRAAGVALCKFFCAWPILMHFESFRQIHLAHHQHLLTERDPDFVRNRPKDLYAARNLIQVLQYLTGLNRKTRHDGQKTGSGLLKISRGMLVTWAAAAVIMWISGASVLFVLYWVLPLFTVFIGLVRIRGLLDHTGIPAETGATTRTTRGNPISNFLFLPHAIGLHGQHHQNPHLPWYQLRGVNSGAMHWHTSQGILAGIFEVLAATRWLKQKRGTNPGSSSAEKRR